MKLKIEVNHEGAAVLEKLARLSSYRGWSRERIAGHVFSCVVPQWFDVLTQPLDIESFEDVDEDELDDDGSEDLQAPPFKPTVPG